MQVDIFASRDLDSRINDREVAAVKEWMENSTQPIHVMRDHPQHTIGMLGAAWDTDLTRKKSRLRWKQAWSRMLKDPLAYAARNKHGSDQTLLDRYQNNLQNNYQLKNMICLYKTCLVSTTNSNEC